MTLRRMFTVVLCLGALLMAAAPARAQDFRGRINGTVSDNTGAVLPGVTIAVTSPALIQPQVQVTGAEGDYRFIALPPGVYEVTFDCPVSRRSSAKAFASSSTIPNARDIWAAMSQAPGLQMTGYDVGGSRTGTQTGFLAYGFGDQATTKLEGINTTEGTSGNAGYFDFGSFEEFQVGGAGNDASADVGGHDILQSTSALNAAGIGKEYNWQPNQRLFGDQGRETSTIWNFKFVGRPDGDD